MHSLMIAGHELHAWAVGMALTMVFLDLGPGFTRDHPPLGRRIGGALIGPLAMLALGCMAAPAPLWLSLLVAAPFAIMGCWYSWCWISATRYELRRSVGRQTAIVGCVSLLVLMLTAGPSNWNGGVVMGVYGASAGVLAGLTFLLLQAWTEERPQQPALAENAVDVPVRVTLVGLGVAAMAGLQVIWATITGAVPHEVHLWVWPALTLVMPVLSCAVGCRFFPRHQRLLWTLALLSAMGGQAVIHTMTMNHPGLIPAAVL